MTSSRPASILEQAYWSVIERKKAVVHEGATLNVVPLARGSYRRDAENMELNVEMSEESSKLVASKSDVLATQNLRRLEKLTDALQTLGARPTSRCLAAMATTETNTTMARRTRHVDLV